MNHDRNHRKHGRHSHRQHCGQPHQQRHQSRAPGGDVQRHGPCGLWPGHQFCGPEYAQQRLPGALYRQPGHRQPDRRASGHRRPFQAPHRPIFRREQPGPGAVHRHIALLRGNPVHPRPHSERPLRGQHVPVHQRHPGLDLVHGPGVHLRHWHVRRRRRAFLLAGGHLPGGRIPGAVFVPGAADGNFHHRRLPHRQLRPLHLEHQAV